MTTTAKPTAEQEAAARELLRNYLACVDVGFSQDGIAPIATLIAERDAARAERDGYQGVLMRIAYPEGDDNRPSLFANDLTLLARAVLAGEDISRWMGAAPPGPAPAKENE